MKQIKVNGIIIAENNSNDFDKMLTMLRLSYARLLTQYHHVAITFE